MAKRQIVSLSVAHDAEPVWELTRQISRLSGIPVSQLVARALRVYLYAEGQGPDPERDGTDPIREAARRLMGRVV